MPEIMISPDSSSVCERNVGSSLTKRANALPMLPASLDLEAGVSESEITGSGTCIDVSE